MHQFDVYMKGSEFYNYIHTLDGYTVASKDEYGELWWYYGMKENGDIIPSQIRIQMGVPAPDFSYMISPDYHSSGLKIESGFNHHRHEGSRVSSIKPLVVLVDFDDSGLPSGVPSHTYTKELSLIHI